MTTTTRDWYARGSRLAREVDPYLAGATLEEAAASLGVPASRIAKLSSNENPLGASPAAVEVLRTEAERARYYPDPGADALRATIGEYLGVDPSQVVVGNGSSSLMHHVVMAFTEPGGEVVSLTPSFKVYSEIAAIQGRSPREFPLRDGDYLLDAAALCATITDRTQLVFLTRPNNPTSTLVPIEDVAAVAEAAAEVGALVVSDEAYIEFADDQGQSAVTLLRGDRPMGNVMLTRTLSKAFGLGNLRLGYAVGNPDAAACLALANAKWPTGAIAQEAGVAAMRDREHLRATLDVVRRGRAMLVEAFTAMGFPVAPDPQANYVMVDVAARGWDAPSFADAVLREGLVMIRGDFSPSHVRVSVGTPEENRRLVDTVAALLGRA